MNKIACFLFVLICCLQTPSYGQDFLGKVKPAELAELSNTSFVKDKAVILQEEVRVDFEYSDEYGFRVNETVSRKIKLYDEVAKEKLKFVVPYAPKGYAREDMTINVSNIYRLVDGQVVKQKSPKQNLIDEDKGNWREKGVSYNDAKAGDIIEYSYIKSTNYIDELPEWYIQSDMPKESASYKVVVPEYFLYSIIKKGDIKLTEQEYNRRVSFRGVNGFMIKSEINAIEKTYKAQLVPSFIVEPYLDNPANYISTVRFDLQQVHFPGNSAEKVMQTEKEFYADLLKNRGFGKELKQDKFLKKEINLEEYKGLSIEAQISKLLNVVQSRVTWNQEYGLFTQNGIKTTFYKGTGNSADVNLLLTAMLRYVGIKANPVLLSTRSNGVKTAWQRNYYNHIITAIEADNSIYLVDATNKYTTLNILSLDDLNGTGTILYDTGAILKVNLMPQFISSKEVKYQINPNSNGSISGQIIENYKNYRALEFRNMYEGSEWRFGKWYESQYVGMNVSSTRVYNGDNNEKDVRAVFSFSKQNGVLFFNDKYIINPFQFYPLYSNPFKSEYRNNPIYIGYPELDNYLMGIVIPEGYKVSILPQNFTLKSEQTGLEVQTKFEVKDNQVLCSLIFIKAKGVIASKDYDSVRDMYTQLLEQLKTQVTLEKK
ncbi:DUF3857 domain-containing protein [Myroides odoratimimus]|uniref:DUF3857 domain-containing protein n=1 Tax=Myroides odoratimimus TaxID=76832 RepID=UPI003D2F5C23